MSSRRVAGVKGRITPAKKARYAKDARNIEAEFPPGLAPPPPPAADAPATTGEYFELREFCGQLRRTRKARKMSLADVQKLTGIDRASISRLERGAVTNPTFATLNRIARAVGCRLGLALMNSGGGSRRTRNPGAASPRR
ncbi:MAG: helix-turn-helix transcriptional regulator [Planctomycetales bacterium]